MKKLLKHGPASVPGGSYVKALTVASTFGPGVKIDHRTILAQEEA